MEKPCNHEDIRRMAESNREIATAARDLALKSAEREAVVADKVLLFAQDIAYIKESIDKIEVKLDRKYVTKEEFSTVKMITYGLAGTILTSFVVGLVALLIQQPI